MTDAELRLIARAAIIGDSSQPGEWEDNAGCQRHTERVVDECDAHVGLGQYWGVIDAVTRHRPSLFLKPLYQGKLVGGLDFAIHLVNAQAQADRLGSGQAVTCGQDDLDARRLD